MRAPLRLALCGLLLAAATSFAEDEVEPPSGHKAEVRKMAGTYRVVRLERGPKAAGPGDLATMKVVLGKDGNGTFTAHGEDTTSRFTTFPNKKPKQVDCTYTSGPAKGMTIKGIYKIEKGVLTCCYGSPGGERPTKFETGGDERLVLYALERVQEK